MRLEPTQAWSVLEAMPDAVFVIDASGQLVFSTSAASRLLGWDVEGFAGRSVLDLVHPDDLAMALVSLESVQHKEVGDPLDIRIATAGGEWRYLQVVGAPLRGVDGLDGIIVSARDQTQRRKFEVAGDSDARFRSVVHHSPVITMLLDANGVVTSVSGAFARILGHDPELVVGTQLSQWAIPGHRHRLHRALTQATRAEGTRNVDATLRHRDGVRDVPLEFHFVNLLDDPVVAGVVVSAFDVTELREAQASLKHLATHDALTGLANRSLLLERIDDALARAGEGTPLTVLFIDLDRFKPVNDLLGHEAGDRLLMEVADRLRSVTRSSDMVGRLGGDEFVVVSEGVAGVDEAQAFARRLEAVVSQPVVLGAGPTEVFASVGFARSDPTSTGESLLAEADGAMYLIKAARRGELRRTVVRVIERRNLAEGLRHAIDNAELEVHYQPVVDLRTERVSGVEALVRWRHPEQGLLYPGDFLSVAEEAGLDPEIGTFVLGEACRQHRAWRRKRAGRELTVAVNVSANQLVDPTLPATVQRILTETGTPPHALCLEISERSILERATRGTTRPATASLDGLKRLGVRLAVDDFGTGYSSLSHVRRLPVDVLKIDQSFVAGLGRDSSDTSIVQAVIGLAQAMRLTSIAEGVERPEQARMLLELGCQHAQGYIYARAVPAREMGALLDVRLGAAGSVQVAS
ncbi:MAG: EAL domain-containing protein [Actinobacteria bacterium]|nr:EAL domain-containing protein [Actinomycetota bacterium]